MANVASGNAGTRRLRSAASSSFVPGFYRALNARSSADLGSAASTERSNLTLPTNADTGDADLPSDCFLVERVISARRHKVVRIKINNALHTHY